MVIKAKWSESVSSISRVKSCIMMLKIIMEKTLVNVTCAYAPQVRLSNQDKDAFFKQLLTRISSVEDSKIHIIFGDFRSCWKESITFDTYHGGKEYGTIDPEGLRILDLCNVTELAASNTFFDKSKNKLITFFPADNNSQVDYILVKRSFLKRVRDVKVTLNEKCVTQHKLLVPDITVDGCSPKPRIVPPRRKTCKIRDLTVCKNNETFVNGKRSEVFSQMKSQWLSMMPGIN